MHRHLLVLYQGRYKLPILLVLLCLRKGTHLSIIQIKRIKLIQYVFLTEQDCQSLRREAQASFHVGL